MKLRKSFIKQDADTDRAKVVGIMGLARGVGATHLAIMLGMYLAHGRHCKVAMVEYGQHGCYEQIRREVRIKEVRLSVKAPQRHAFSYKGIDFYESVKIPGFPGILAEIYDYIIIDMCAVDLEKRSWLFGEWLNSEISVAVSSFSPWKSRECRARLMRIMGQAAGKTVSVVSLTTKPKDCLKHRNEICKDIKLIPWEPDPFYIRAENMLWFQHIVGLQTVAKL